MVASTKRRLSGCAWCIIIGLFLGPQALSSCHDGPHQSGSLPESTGVALFPLEATAASGTVYRLIGQFRVEGARTFTIGTADYPDQSAVSQSLIVGDYTVTLNEGWQLLRRADDIYVDPEHGALLSPPTQAFSISAGQTTSVRFSFAVDGELVSTYGNLELSIEVSERPTGVGGAGGSGGGTGTGGIAGSSTGGSVSEWKQELFWEFPASANPPVLGVETLLTLRDDPNVMLIATHNVGAACGGGTAASIWRAELDPTTRLPLSVSLVQQLPSIQCVRFALFESSTDGTLFTGGGWCGAKPPYYSTDHGRTWSVAIAGSVYPPNSVFSYGEFEGSVYAGTGYSPYLGEIYRWMGAGTWERVFAWPAARNIVGSMRTYQGRLFAAGQAYEGCNRCAGTVPVYYTEDGRNFVATSGIPECHDAMRFFVIDDKLYTFTKACGQEIREIYAWENVTSSWFRYADASPTLGEISAEALGGMIFAMAPNRKVLTVSRDIGKTWETLLAPNPPVETGRIWRIVPMGNTVYWNVGEEASGVARIYRIAF